MTFAADFIWQCQKQCVILHPMFDHLRKYAKLLMPILLGLFFVSFVIDDYADEPRKMKGVVAECLSEMEADESECEEDEFADEASFGSYSLMPNGLARVFLGTMQLSSSKQSAEQFRGLVRRYAPRSISTYNQLFNNGMDLIQVCAIFYFDKYLSKFSLHIGSETLRHKTRDIEPVLSPQSSVLSQKNNNTLIHKLWTLQAF